MFNFVHDCKANPIICQMSEEKISPYIQVNMVWMHRISLSRILFFSFSEQYTFLKIKIDTEQELILESDCNKAVFLSLSLLSVKVSLM